MSSVRIGVSMLPLTRPQSAAQGPTCVLADYSAPRCDVRQCSMNDVYRATIMFTLASTLTPRPTSVCTDLLGQCESVLG
eukprot:973562-Amphidinium_carterae.1